MFSLYIGKSTSPNPPASYSLSSVIKGKGSMINSGKGSMINSFDEDDKEDGITESAVTPSSITALTTGSPSRDSKISARKYVSFPSSSTAAYLTM